MNTQELIQKVKKIDIKTQKSVAGTFTGAYHAIFKGTGINFEEVKEYQPGDDIRRIDWNVTAKTGTPHIKRFTEERELTVMILLDISASTLFASHNTSKKDAAAEIAAILGFSAIANNDKVGLLQFSNQVESVIPPKKGKKHILSLLSNILSTTPKSQKTNLTEALNYTGKLLKKRAIIFILSDFIDNNYEHALKALAAKHEVVPIIIEDPGETELPKSGIIRLQDPETEESLIINTASKSIRERYKNIHLSHTISRDRVLKNCHLRPITLLTNKNIQLTLAGHFKSQSRRQK